MDKIVSLDLPANYRLIVISDIHGSLTLFKALLNKVMFSATDYLIINGDLVEKGPDSYGVVNEIRQLMNSNSHVYVIEGNCDPLVENLVDAPDELLSYSQQRSASLLNEWLTLEGTSIAQIATGQALVECLAQPYATDITWLKELPTAIETRDFIFVHAGLSDRADWQNTDRLTALTLPLFFTKQHQAEQYVVVGHYPVANYITNSEPPSSNIKVDDERRIIAIDGGNQLKRDGQLNALIITSENDSLHFSEAAVDDLPIKIIKEAFEPVQFVPAGNLYYPDSCVDILEKGRDFSRCRNVNSGDTLWLNNEHLDTRTEQPRVTQDTTTYQLAVAQGDIVSIVDDAPKNYTLIKKDGVTGWIPSHIL